MQDPLRAQTILRQYGIRPNKKLGQNFIIKRSALMRVLDAAGFNAPAQILEIGAGLGALTLELARREHQVIAVEYDIRLIPVLEDLLSPYENVSILRGDILELKLNDILAPPAYHVVANIPYQITSAVIRKLVEATFPARDVVLTIQKEVAQRIIDVPGNLSLLALSVQVYGKPELHAHIPAAAFYPKPGVDSSVLRISMYPEPVIPAGDLDRFFRIAKAGFSQKRKMLKNSLASGLGFSTHVVEEKMSSANVPATLRPQMLDLEMWHRLCLAFSELG